MRQTDECTRMYLLSFPRLRPSIAGKHVSLRDGKRCRYPERGKKTACLSNSRLESQSTVVIVCSSCLSFSLSLSLSYPPSGDIKIFHVLDRERRGRGGLVGESMVSRPQCVHVARYITRLQRRAPTRDIRQWFNVWIRELGTVSLESASEVLSYRIEEEKKRVCDHFFFSIYFLKSLRYGKLRVFIP